jgi:hypothetical protein
MGAQLEVEWVNFSCKSDFKPLLTGEIAVPVRLQIGYA